MAEVIYYAHVRRAGRLTWAMVHELSGRRFTGETKQDFDAVAADAMKIWRPKVAIFEHLRSCEKDGVFSMPQWNATCEGLSKGLVNAKPCARCQTLERQLEAALVEIKELAPDRRRCEWCNEPLPIGARRDKRMCGQACTQAKHRAKKAGRLDRR